VNAWSIAALTLAIAVLAHRIGSTHSHTIEHLDRQTNHLVGVFIVSTQDVINAITDQLVKAQREIVSRIADVQAQLDAAGVAPDQVDLSSLTAAAQALDDVVPDAPAEVPVDVPAEDPAVVEPVDG